MGLLTLIPYPVRDDCGADMCLRLQVPARRDGGPRQRDWRGTGAPDGRAVLPGSDQPSDYGTGKQSQRKETGMLLIVLLCHDERVVPCWCGNCLRSPPNTPSPSRPQLQECLPLDTLTDNPNYTTSFGQVSRRHRPHPGRTCRATLPSRPLVLWC